MVPETRAGGVGDQPSSVSVVVPTHRRPQLVLDAVRSIVSQTFDGTIEVLVVFDNCDPHPIDVRCPPGRSVHLLVNDARTPGLAGARNTGILAATGEYVGFCDDDDTWLPGKLEAQLSALRRFGSDAICTTGSLVVGDGSATERPGPSRTLGLDDFLRDRIMELASGSLLLRREHLLGAVGLIDEQLPNSYGEDYDLLLRGSRLLPVVNVPRPLVKVAFHSGSFYASRWTTIVDALEYLLRKHPEFRRSPRGRARIRGQVAFAYAALGDRRRALGAIRAALRENPFEKRAYAALAVVLGVQAPWIAAVARRRGHGV